MNINPHFRPLSANFTKWLNTPKQFVGNFVGNWVKVHVGFVFYSLQRYDEAVKWLKAGIQSNHEGVHHPRFYFHLGDACNRLGRTNEVSLYII